MNTTRLRNFYLESQVYNSSPGQRLIMLYDGLIQQAEALEAHLAKPSDPVELASAGQTVSRSIDILTELTGSLRFEVDPVLCGTLHDLYVFFTREFSASYESKNPKRIRPILNLIRELRKAWASAEKSPSRLQAVEAA